MTGRQIIVHAGFHKTGTTSAQATLQANGKCIWPTHALVTPKRITEVLRVATLHSVTRGPVSMEEFRSRLSEFLATLSLGKKRGLILSAENLSGLMPGRMAHYDYDACPDLMAEVATAVHRQWRNAEITFVFGLREKESWLRSAYWQNLRSSRLIDDFPSFSAKLAEVDLAETTRRVGAAVPDARVLTTRLEDTRDLRFGPATPILDLAHLRPDLRAELVARPIANASPSQGVIDACLALNRSKGTDSAIAQQKIALLRSWHPVSNSARIA